jgi:hypothetical protein
MLTELRNSDKLSKLLLIATTKQKQDRNIESPRYLEKIEKSA